MSARIAVTGASSGIGAATARHLARAGFEVVCAARRTDRIEALAAEIGGRAVACDVTDADQVAGLAEAVGPRLEVLVNNAGGAFGLSPVAEADADEWQRMYDVNVIGLMRVTQALLPALVASGAGVIVNVGSLAGRRAYEGGAGLHRGQARHEGGHRDAAARAGRPAGPDLRGGARDGADRGVRAGALRRRPGAGRRGLRRRGRAARGRRRRRRDHVGSRPGRPTSTSTSS